MKTIAIILYCAAVVRAFPQGFGNSAPTETPGHADDAFQFAYAVASPEHGTYHGHQATRDQQGHTSGSYYVLAADGNWRQTIYADKGLGFQAVSNQRPVGSPPPQASAVNYQIFVHPGATALSANGAGPVGGDNFNFPTLESAIHDAGQVAASAQVQFPAETTRNVRASSQLTDSARASLPQASAVSYQIFLHPGATALSASGAGPGRWTQL